MMHPRPLISQVLIEVLLQQPDHLTANDYTRVTKNALLDTKYPSNVSDGVENDLAGGIFLGFPQCTSFPRTCLDGSLWSRARKQYRLLY